MNGINSSNSHKETCSFCNRKLEKLYSFSPCSHKICILCLFERIFTKHITQFQGQNTVIIHCKCEIGYSQYKLSSILSILQEKKNLDLNSPHETGTETVESTKEGCECHLNNDNFDENAKYFSDYLCLDCLKWICQRCKNDINNIHYYHRVSKSRYILKYIKENISRIFLKASNTKQFLEIMNELSKNFQTLIEENFNATISKIDNLIITIEKLKNKYIDEYLKQIEDNLRTFEIIKLLYMNYFADNDIESKRVNVETSNIYKLKYISNISHEFSDLKLTHLNEFDEEIAKIKEKIESINVKEIKLFSSEFKFQKVYKDYILDEIIPAHSKLITSLIVYDNKIISGSVDYTMKLWDNESGIYKCQQSIKTKQVINLLALKNGKIFLSSLNSNDILVFEPSQRAGTHLVQTQSLTHHDKCVSSIAELDDGKVASGSLDGKIGIWEENEKSKQYILKQTIDCQNQVMILISLTDFKIAYSTGETGIINILKAEEDSKDGKISCKNFENYCELEKQTGKVSCMYKLNNGYFLSGGGDTKNNKDHNMYLWAPAVKKYNLIQTIFEAHGADINSIILLKNGKIASASSDRTVKIWEVVKPINDNKIKIVLHQVSNHYGHGLYKLIQLKDGRLVVSSTDKNLVFWRNGDSVFSEI